MQNIPLQNCPCGSGQSFENCCGQYIRYLKYPDNPEQLMRSRYSAYVLKNEDYLLKSWHQSTRPELIKLEDDLTQWEKLKIISASENSVKFVAYFLNLADKKNAIYALSESSVFIYDTHWYYLSGKEFQTIELSKNMLCPCKSGKKFKRCCANDW